MVTVVIRGKCARHRRQIRRVTVRPTELDGQRFFEVCAEYACSHGCIELKLAEERPTRIVDTAGKAYTPVE